MKNILISVSGGLSSALLLFEVLKRYNKEKPNYYNFLICFANTGDENEETLIFVNKLDKQIQKEYGICIYWLEAYVSPIKNKGCFPVLVDFNSASRDGSPMLDQSEKLGHCAISAPHCTRDLKVSIIHKFAKSYFGKKQKYFTMQGIRADEQSRINWETAKNKNYKYPLAEWGITKQDVNDFWKIYNKTKGFTLNLKSYEGNCNLCFKKSDFKLIKLIREKPCLALFRITLELVSANDNHDQYRGNRSIFDLLDLAKSNIKDNQLSLFGGECFCS